MMKVEVRVFATLRQYMPGLGIGEPKIVEVPEGMTFAELRDMLKLPAKEVKIVMCNNLQADFDALVKDGDRITYIPAVAGG
jgi:molybdopterin converting factor small subunit